MNGYLENRSFDQMLGILQTVYSDLDGIDPTRPRRINTDHEGNRFEQLETRETVVDPDPPHELLNVLRQIEAAPPAGPDLAPSYSWTQRIVRGIRSALRTVCSYSHLRGRLRMAAEALAYEGRFVREYSETFPTTAAYQRQQIISYFPLDFLPALPRLARDFTICDHWFSSVPASTWPNRYFVTTGTSLGRVSTPNNWHDFRAFHLYDQDTLFYRLTERDIPWKVYHDGAPQTLALAHQRERDNRRRYFRMDQFLADSASDPSAFPAFCFIEPRYGGRGTDDDHPPHDTMRAQALLATVYNALRCNPDLWHSILLVVLYDEHGGFYDHICPPNAVRPVATTSSTRLTDSGSVCRHSSCRRG